MCENRKEFYKQYPECEDSLVWAIKEYMSIREAQTRPYVLDEEFADLEIKYCPNCKKCWEKPKSGKGRKTVVIYDDFPTHGKTRVKCPYCTKEFWVGFVCSL